MQTKRCILCRRTLAWDMFTVKGTAPRLICDDCYDEGQVTPEARKFAQQISHKLSRYRREQLKRVGATT